MAQIFSFFSDLWKIVIDFDWTFRLITLFFPLIPVVVYKHFPKWIKRFRINALNANLKYGINLSHYVYLFYFILLFSFVIIISSILLVFLTGNYDYLWLLITVGGMLLFHHLFYRFKRKESEGLVGLIDSDFHAVANIKLDPNEEFHLADCQESYEKRKPIRENDIPDKCKIISTYYDELKEAILSQPSINQNLFVLERSNNRKVHICDYLKQLYSYRILSYHINEVDKNRSSDNTIYFIGDKIGINGFHYDGNKLCIHGYMTDHFTWKVFKSIYQSESVKNTLKQVIRRINIANPTEKNYIIACLKYLLSSFGIDIIIHGKTATGKRGMLVGLRNGGIEAKGNCKLHVPVNESFSSTDRAEGDATYYSLYECARRGIEEELGIRRSLIPSQNILFYDFAIVTDEGEIGLGCQLDLTSIMPLEQSRMYPGQDKFLELKDLIIIPYLPFVWDSRKYPKLLYSMTQNDAFCSAWESFTPLLYQRIVVRNSTWSSQRIALLNTITYLLLIAFLYFIIYEGDKLYRFVLSFTLSSIVTIAWLLIKHWYLKLILKLKSRKFSYFNPLISQWGSDVTVIQSAANNIPKDGNPILSNLYFGLLTDRNQKVNNINSSFVTLNELTLTNPPHCSVRSALDFDNAECPIGFYQVKKSCDNIIPPSNHIYFKIIPFLSTRDSKCQMYFEVRIQNEKISYHFSKDMDVTDYPILEKKENITSDEVSLYSKLYSIEESILKSLNIYKLPEYFKKRYRPFDLFYYKRNYYWSLDILKPDSENWLNSLKDDHKHRISINGKTNLYEEVKKQNIKKTTGFLLEGTPQNLRKCLVRFITNQQNLKRIVPLDIYILQLSFMRRSEEGIVLADIKEPWYNCIIKYI